MKWQTEHEFLGTEFDFVLADASGRVAYVTSAGAGPIPDVAENAGERMFDLCEDVARLSRVSSAELVSTRPNRAEWFDAAERGFFAYDWSYAGQRYELIARPTSPLRVPDLADHPEVQALLQHARLSAEFGEVIAIS